MPFVLGHTPAMSGPQPSIRRPRRSACADAALRAELGRVARMTVEERVKAALTMRERFAWLQPETEKRVSIEK
jgi:hypothetical protein